MKKTIILLGALSLVFSAGALDRKFSQGYEIVRLPQCDGTVTGGLSLYNGNLVFSKADSTFSLSLPDTAGVLPSQMEVDEDLSDLKRDGQMSFDTVNQILYVSHKGLLYRVDPKKRGQKQLDIDELRAYRKDFGEGSSLAYRRWRFKEPGVVGLFNPAVSPNGKRLFFSAELEGGKGGRDIWMIQPKEDGTWSAPVNVAPANSPDNEDFPFVAGDSLLYFASDRSASFQGWNVFRMKLKVKKGTVSKPEILPDGINSNGNDFNFVGNDKAIFVVSDRSGVDEIYTAKRLPVVEPVGPTVPEKAEPVPAQFHPCTFYFMLDSEQFAEDYEQQIKSVALYLKQNPDAVIGISGHTDSRGSLEYNMDLSGRRSRMVYDELVRAGAKPSQLKVHSFGKSQLAVKNANTNNDHLLNRRVELNLEE